MKALFIQIILPVLSLGFIVSCRVEPLKDPNNPSPAVIAANATASEIQNLVDGIESGLRNDMNYYYDDVNMIGREYYRFQGSDPRVTADILGKGDSRLDNNTFYITNPYAARYRVIKNANILIDALTNTKASTVTADQRKAGIAYAKTVQAYQYLLVFNLLYDSIRIDVKDPDHLGPFLPRPQALDAIANLLNEAGNDLKNTSIFPFATTLHPPLKPEDTVRLFRTAPFYKFNRALAARVAIFKQDWNAADAALSESFLDLNGDLKAGVYNLYSSAGGDQLNPVFFPPNSASTDTRVAHSSFVTDAEPGDKRVAAKTSKRTSTATLDDLSSDYDLFLYKTNVDPVPIIRNEELILIYAEVKAQLNQPSEAVKAINIIRNAAGLSNYAGAQDTNSLIKEILKQRRYSLFGEGHRWIDLRRYNLLSQLPIDRPGDDVWLRFPVPANE